MTSELASEGHGLPSRNMALLRSLVGRTVVGATRYSWWVPSEAQNECRLAESKDVFSLTSGPAVIEFDSGFAIGVASDPSLNSVSVWVERDESGVVTRTEPVSSDGELYPVSATDPQFASVFWHQVIGASVSSVSVLVRLPSTARLGRLPNEVGLCFSLDSGAKFVAAHGLHDDSDDFVLIPEQLILSSLRSELNDVLIS